jgi:hypothetical protein
MNKEDWLSNYYDSNIEFITQGLDEKDRDELKEIYRKICYEDYELLNNYFFIKKGNPEISNLIYIMAITRRVYSLLFCDEKNKIKLIKGQNDTKKLDLIRLYFNHKDLINYLNSYVPKYINILDDFKYIDGEADICGIIANNYVNKIIEEVRNISDTKKEMRNLKIEKIIK